MPTVPLRGYPFHAPSSSAPKERFCVNAYHVEPSPMPAAMTRDSISPISSRTCDPVISNGEANAAFAASGASPATSVVQYLVFNASSSTTMRSLRRCRHGGTNHVVDTSRRNLRSRSRRLSRCGRRCGLHGRRVRSHLAAGFVHQSFEPQQRLHALAGEHGGTDRRVPPALLFEDWPGGRRVRSNARDLLELDALMRISHDLVPGLRR